MTTARTRFLRAYEANRHGDFTLETLQGPLGRRTCFDCDKRREGCMLLELGDKQFVACRPCTERILKLDRAAEPAVK